MTVREGDRAGWSGPASARRRKLRRWCLYGIASLYIASVPWYRASDAPLEVWFGLPDWVAVALLCYVAVAILNALAWFLTEVSDHTGAGLGPRDLPEPPHSSGAASRGGLAAGSERPGARG